MILYYQHDALRVGQIIEAEFEVDWDNSYRHDPSAEPDRFGYRSDHYVVHLGASRRDLAEWRSHRHDCAEIQVRTVMQHAWGAVDHKIRYKAPDLPPSLQRHLYQLSALLEVADGQFAELEAATNEAASTYEASVGAGELDVALDALSLRAYLDNQSMDTAWAERAHAAGFKPPLTAEALAENREPRIEELLRELQEAGFRTLSQFERLLASAESWGATVLSSISEGIAPQPSPVPEHVLLMLLQVVWKSEQSIVRVNWRPDIALAIGEAFKLPTINLDAIL